MWGAQVCGPENSGLRVRVQGKFRVQGLGLRV